jgi:hypothetical protein
MQKKILTPLFLAILFLFSVLFYSCSKDNGTESGLFNKWNWVSSTGGFAGITYSPDLTGDKIEFIFYPDFTYQQFRNDTLLEESTYKLVVAQSSFGNECAKMIVYNKSGIQQFYRIEGNMLILTDDMADGFESLYSLEVPKK